MKIFPENDYSFELNNDSSIAISKLENQTLSKEQFVTNFNNQAFIGKIDKNEFKINLSKKLFGKVCVLSGNLENEKGSLKIRTGKIFKIIFVAFFIFTISGIVSSIIQGKSQIIINLILSIIVIRFIILELAFRLISNNAINQLTEIIEIKKITKI